MPRAFGPGPLQRARAVPAVLALLPAFALLLALESLLQAETPIPPSPSRWVTDRAAFLYPAAVADLDARLGAYQRTTGHQILVYVDRTTGGVPIEDWTVRAFQAWRVGRRGIDDGLVLFVFSQDRRARIEVGYGLEDRVPDAIAKRIIEERIVPRLRAGDPDGAIQGGVAALTATVGGEGDPSKGRGAIDQAPAPIALWKLIVGGLALVGFIAFLITHPSLAWLLLMSIGSGRGGGGWGGGGGGGGGFSGGGGRSGGGGASGSW
jgi:uncharacterized protein